jgi:pimeloyl-ACP methyl ester carboxylesterase
MSTDNSNATLSELPRTVISRDGTAISYLTTGRGPPVIVVPGVLSTANSYASFADALGQNHTVHTIHRRGRGQSGPQGDDYSIIKECEDVAAVQETTNSTLIFGHSYGGLIALEVARTSQVFLKVAVYEPGVSIDSSIAMGWMPAYQRKLAEAKPLDAFAAFSVGAGPTRARKVPIWLMKRLLPLFIGSDERQQIFDLLPANLREHQVVGQLDNSYRGYQQIQAETLIMFGGKSGLGWVVGAISALASVIPSVAVQEFPRLDHSGPDKTGSLEVANAVGAFFERRAASQADDRAGCG